MVAVRNEKVAVVDKVYELREVRESACCAAIPICRDYFVGRSHKL